MIFDIGRCRHGPPLGEDRNQGELRLNLKEYIGETHRDYLELGSEVHIDIFDDRMEITSPGGMPSGERAQELDLRKVISLRRNPVIADLFQRLDLMERRGSGFGKILRAYDLESRKRGRDFKVLFSSIHMGFTLVLPNLNYGQTIEGLVGEEPSGDSGKSVMDGKSVVRAAGNVDWDVDRNVVRILDVVRDNPHITQHEIATSLNLSLRGVEDMIKRAREKGLIRRVGGKRFGHWEVVK